MVRDYLEPLCKELTIDIPKFDEKKLTSFFIGENQITLKDLSPGVAMQAQICACPTKKKEMLFIHLMRANLLGQGTGGARIGLDMNEKFLTLSLGLPYEMNYQHFKDHLEEFINYLLHWRQEVANFEREEIM